MLDHSATGDFAFRCLMMTSLERWGLCSFAWVKVGRAEEGEGVT
jgi:hypothetical protein